MAVLSKGGALESRNEPVFETWVETGAGIEEDAEADTEESPCALLFEDG